MTVPQKLVTLGIAHALLFGCAVQLDATEAPVLDGDDGARQTAEGIEQGPSAAHPSAQWYAGHEGVTSAGVEQWLRFQDLTTGEAPAALELCDATEQEASHAPCADADSEGQLITHWTPVDQPYRMRGTLGDGTSFTLIDVARADNINRLPRPIGVMTGAALQACYGDVGVKRSTGRHTVLARARTGPQAARGVRFELQPIACDDTLPAPGCASHPNAEGEGVALQATRTNAQHGLFLDVAPGLYALRGVLDGVACGSAEAWLDGEVEQVIAPELHCE